MGVGGQRYISGRFTPGKEPVPIVWASGPVWTGGEYLASAELRNPDRPFHTTLDIPPVIAMEGDWCCINFRLSYCCGAELVMQKPGSLQEEYKPRYRATFSLPQFAVACRGRYETAMLRKTEFLLILNRAL